ncbi:MAG: hypothetical protein RR540_07145 [Oscillospiraceae bacterium]
MNDFITLREHYCPIIGRNIVIERFVFENVKKEQTVNICLNSHECHCGKSCKNKLLDCSVQLSGS